MNKPKTEVNEDMVQRAIEKAVELEIIPRFYHIDDGADMRGKIKELLESALARP